MATGSQRLLLCFLLVLLFFQVFAETSLDQVFAETSLDHGMELLDDKGGAATLDKFHRRPKINCNFACARRCRKSSRKNVCHRACGTCCLRCHCVPAGTYGNKNSCPCYASLRTHGKKPKCP